MLYLLCCFDIHDEFVFLCDCAFFVYCGSMALRVCFCFGVLVVWVMIFVIWGMELFLMLVLVDLFFVCVVYCNDVF